MGAFLPYKALPGLKNYKYASEDRSLVSKYVLKPLYVRIVDLLPRWLAPNMVTLLGLLFSVVSFTRTWYYDRNFDNLNVPRWVYFAHAFDLFMYQTLDALDGQQARRTGSSSPLGELFDHCVDAINTSLQAYVVSSVLSLPPKLVLLSQFVCSINFFLSTWEEYYTHKLFLSAFSGPVEGILLMVGMEIFTGFVGPQFWVNKFSLLGLEFQNHDVLVFGSAVGILSNSAAALANVRDVVKTDLPEKLKGVIPFLTMWAGFASWAVLTWTTIVGNNGLLPYFLAAAFTFALLVGRIITAHVTSQEYPMWNPLLAVPYVGIVFHFISPESDLQTLWALVGVSFAVYGAFVGEVISEITTYLGIGCLYIKGYRKRD